MHRPDKATCQQNKLLNPLKLKEMKKIIIMVLTSIFCLTTANAQKTVISQKNDMVFDVVEQMPEYPGGMQALFEYLSQSIKYPEDAQKQKIEGKVIASFVVRTDGSITDISLFKKVFPSLDDEAVRVLQGMPKWTPGKQGGKVVNVKYTVPVNFRLK